MASLKKQLLLAKSIESQERHTLFCVTVIQSRKNAKFVRLSNPLAL